MTRSFILSFLLLSLLILSCNDEEKQERLEDNDGDTSVNDGDTSVNDGDTSVDDGDEEEISATDGDVTDGDDKETATGDGDEMEIQDGDLEDFSPQPNDSTYIEYYQARCPWMALCWQESLEHCLNFMEEDDAVVFASYYRKGCSPAGPAAPISCYREAESCEEYLACEGFDLSSSCSDSDHSSCQGNQIDKCYNEYPKTVDCGKQGLKCVETPDGDEVISDCGLPGVTCSEGERCHGDYFLWCPGDYTVLPLIFDCAGIDKTCLDGVCADLDESGAGDSFPCDGPYIKNLFRGHYATYDCRDLDPDFVCSETDLSGNDQAQCMIPVDQQTCVHGEIRCDDHEAVVCVMGKEIRIDCALIPGATCKNKTCVLEQ